MASSSLPLQLLDLPPELLDALLYLVLVSGVLDILNLLDDWDFV